MTESTMHETVAPVRLRRAREEAGLHIVALASALKVPVHKLEALEEGRYDELPDMVFARALASSVCRHLQVDPGPVLDEIPHPDATLGEIPRAISAPFRTSAVDLGGSAAVGSGGMKKAAWLAGVLVLAAVVVMLLPENMPWSGWLTPAVQNDVVAEPVSSASETPVVAPLLQGAVAPTQGEAPVSESPGEGAVPAPGNDTVPAVSTADTAAATGDAPVAAGLLVLTARGDSWVEVTNGHGAVVVQRMMRAGDALDFSTSPPYTVVLGRADQVDVSVRGKPFDVLPLARNSVARFEVK
ncbi:MAG: helix-turn-helix domain-containing protein [Hydrogenophaga sp.]|jgi:cytoskeleton protein RodZ|uniref:helix-turn-helix domain-containing protein n=1 Tax=Hydrogenophaga sp. TaxID=1904254 RepID=UPI00261740F1|nr:helix-turn-helix domain-containing protein [Hydrogenophaga sp.]MDD3784586.1 helix-turn-helix domain-containing protein [Hydrogenophaga sp.]MDX9968280.1 helix-turn-helix domain-containing protein [Hydrogenophaga sp.]